MQSKEHVPFLVALTKINKVGPKLAKVLVSYSGGYEAVFQQSKKALLAIPGIGPQIASAVLDMKVMDAVEKELLFLEKNPDIQLLPYTHPNFPSRLRQYDDGPLLIYSKGDNQALNPSRSVGIVGTRSPSQYGRSVCENLVEQLKEYNVSIISGLAYGVDTIAHRTAVKSGISTLGFLAHGLDIFYPAENRKLANSMLEKGGLVTEFGPGSIPAREHFPMRNRLIAAMSDVLIVVESAIKGGSMITAELANSYNKDVFAIPGRLSDSTSEGCNFLIKTHKAALYQSTKDLSYIMGWTADNQSSVQLEIPLDLTPEELSIINYLKQKETVHLDKLHHALELPLSKLASLLLNLEFKSLVRSLPGKKYTLANK